MPDPSRSASGHFFLMQSRSEDKHAEAVKRFEEEKEVLEHLAHATNTIHLVDSLPDELTLVLPYFMGGKLDARLQEVNTEDTIFSWFTDALRAVRSVHSMRVAHRDINSNSFVFETPEANSHLILVNFQHAVYFKSNELALLKAPKKSRSIRASMRYKPHPLHQLDRFREFFASPEVLQMKKKEGLTAAQWQASDMYSLGVLLHFLLTGSPPFLGPDWASYNSGQIRAAVLMKSIDDSVLDSLSGAAGDLLRGLLHKDPDSRLTAEAALLHPAMVMTDQLHVDNTVAKSVVHSFQALGVRSQLLESAAHLLVKMEGSTDFSEKFAAAFKQYDKNGDGRLDKQEIEELMVEVGLADSSNASEMTRSVMARIDKGDSEGEVEIDPKDFRAILMEGQILQNVEVESGTLFRLLDVSHKGFLTKADLERLKANGEPELARLAESVEEYLFQVMLLRSK